MFPWEPHLLWRELVHSWETLQGTEGVGEDPDDSSLHLKWKANVGNVFQRLIERLFPRRKRQDESRYDLPVMDMDSPKRWVSCNDDDDDENHFHLRQRPQHQPLFMWNETDLKMLWRACCCFLEHPLPSYFNILLNCPQINTNKCPIFIFLAAFLSMPPWTRSPFRLQRHCFWCNIIEVDKKVNKWLIGIVRGKL